MKADSPPPPPRDVGPETEEFVRTDDAVIGRATRWSLLALFVIALLAAGVWFWMHPKPKAPETRLTGLRAPATAQRQDVQIPDAQFTEITAAAGIHFTHFNGAEGEKLLPETMGGAGAFLDYDNDGLPDLFFVNGSPWPWAKNPPATPPTHALYHNEGQGRFADVTAGSGLDVSFYGMGTACGDFDNDGRVDILITAVGRNRLFKNVGGGKFAEVTDSAGVGGDPDQWSTSAAFLDVDRDGDLDLLVVKYVRWSRDIDLQVGFTIDGHHRAYYPPMGFQGSFVQLYRNDGGGHFTDISAQAGVQIKNPVTGVPAAKSLGIAAADLNDDGWIDLVIANDTVQNFVFTNRHDGTFSETGASLGVAFDSLGNARGAMGIDIARHRNDEALAVGIGNFANEMTALFVHRPGSTVFTDEAIAEGIGPASRLPLKFGLFFFDYDLDGWPDLLTANGHLEEDISKLQKSQTYRQSAQLFWNAGPALDGFVEVKADKAGSDLFRPIVGRGSAYADIDGDGDLDVVLFQCGGPPLLLRNDQHTRHHWVRLKLVGTASNHDAIGATVKLSAGGITQWREVMPTRSYLSQSELPVTFGLGTLDRVDAVEILWPSGSRQTLSALPPLDKTTTIQEP